MPLPNTTLLVVRGELAAAGAQMVSARAHVNLPRHPIHISREICRLIWSFGGINLFEVKLRLTLHMVSELPFELAHDRTSPSPSRINDCRTLEVLRERFEPLGRAPPTIDRSFYRFMILAATSVVPK